MKEPGGTDREAFTYRDAGVDIDRADAVKERIRTLVEGTRTERVRSVFGSFAGRFSVERDADLVATADGVGTKLRVAFRTGRHDTVGEDLVNHCVNDVLSEGAVPIVFLDYVGCGELDEGVVLDVVRGVARGCRSADCALLGGETAEMPDSYPPGEYDLVGFMVGRVAYPEVARRDLREGDRLVALASTGLHTNGYTFARKLLFQRAGLDVEDPWPGMDVSVGEVLLRIHRSYLAPLAGPCAAGRVRALAHVTGGGIPGNLRRVLPEGLDAAVDTESWTPPAEFRWLAEESAASRDELYRTLNMGVGMIAVVRPDDTDGVIRAADDHDVAAFVCGELVAGSGRVRLVP